METPNLSQQRAEVIEKFINLEWIINAIISQHYFGKVRIDFILQVLYDERCSFSLKREVLKKIVPTLDQMQIEKLNRLNNIRNYFAHTGQQIFNTAKITPGESDVGYVPDPRNLDKVIDFTQLFEEFQKTEPSVTKYLFDVFIEHGGEAVEG